MSLDIKYIKDNEGNNFFPVVHEKGVVDDNGTTLESKLQSKQDAIGDIDTIRSGATAGSTAIQSVTVGTTTTGAAGTNASVTNTGTATEPILSFTIPQGAQGIQGIQGPQGERGPQGNTGVQVDSVASIIHSIDPTATYAAADVAGADAVQDVLSEVTELAGKLALGAVYDVSAENPTAGPNSDGKWETLSTLLSDANLNTLIPTALRKGGMSIKFIQSSDNKYVQYRYMGTAVTGTPNPFLDTDNWQGVDDEPTAGSTNLVESCGVKNMFNDIIGYSYNKDISVTGTTTTTTDINLSNGKKYTIFVQCSTAVDNKFTGIYFYADSSFTKIKDLTSEEYSNGIYFEYTPNTDGTLYVRPYATGTVNVIVWSNSDFVSLNGKEDKVYTSVFNINKYYDSYTPYENTEIGGNLARQSVPVSYRKCGLIVMFLTTAGWRKEQFIGNSDLDLSDNDIWRAANNWKPLEGNEFININSLVDDLDTPFDSLYSALLAVTQSEYRKKGTIITFLHGCSQIDEIVVNSPKAILDGTLTITVEGTDYTVPYANEETRDSIYTKIAALTIPNHTITYTSGNTYVFITADEIGSKPSASVSTTGGLTVSYIEYRKGTNKNWRTYQYINDTNLNYWSNINYWQALYVNSDESDDSYIISAIASESFQYSNITYSNGNLLSASIKWPDGVLGQMDIVYNGDKISYINYTRDSETYRQTLTYTNGELSKTEINKL